MLRLEERLGQAGITEHEGVTRLRTVTVLGNIVGHGQRQFAVRDGELEDETGRPVRFTPVTDAQASKDGMFHTRFVPTRDLVADGKAPAWALLNSVRVTWEADGESVIPIEVTASADMRLMLRSPWDREAYTADDGTTKTRAAALWASCRSRADITAAVGEAWDLDAKDPHAELDRVLRAMHPRTVTLALLASTAEAGFSASDIATLWAVEAYGLREHERENGYIDRTVRVRALHDPARFGAVGLHGKPRFNARSVVIEK